MAKPHFSAGRRQRLRRPWYWVLLIWACGIGFALIGLLMVGGDPDETGSFHWDAFAIGGVCLVVGVGFAYAYGWAPKAWIDGDTLYVRRLGGRGLRVRTSRLARRDVESVYAGERDHDVMPLMVTFPVLVLTSGTEDVLEGHSRYVPPWRSSNAATLHEVNLLARWCNSSESDEGGPGR